MRYEIIDCEQNTPEWHEARKGMPTSSRYKDVLAQGEGKMRSKYMRQLAGEILSGKPMKTYKNDEMEEGHRAEPIIREQYSFDNGLDVERLGFVKMNPALCVTGCSPDGLVGSSGMVEFKSMITENLVEVLDTGKMPNHQAQIQGGLWIMERKWCDLVIGNAEMPYQKTFRIMRDEPFIAKLIFELKRFNVELNEMVKRIRERE